VLERGRVLGSHENRLRKSAGVLDNRNMRQQMCLKSPRGLVIEGEESTTQGTKKKWPDKRDEIQSKGKKRKKGGGRRVTENLFFPYEGIRAGLGREMVGRRHWCSMGAYIDLLGGEEVFFPTPPTKRDTRYRREK